MPDEPRTDAPENTGKKAPKPPKEKKTGGIPFGVLFLLCLAGIAGGSSLWQLWMAAEDAQVFLPPGYAVEGLPLSYASPSPEPSPSVSPSPSPSPVPSVSPDPDPKASVHVYAAGARSSPDAPAALMLGSWDDVSPVLSFNPLILELGADVKSIVVELPGHGWSGNKCSPRTSENMVEDIRFALAGIGEDAEARYVVVAEGTAGITALAMTRLYPDMVAGIVTVDSPPPAAYSYDAFGFLDVLRAVFTPVPRVTGIFRVASVINPELFTPGEGEDAEAYRAAYFARAGSAPSTAERIRAGANAKAELATVQDVAVPAVSFADYTEYYGTNDIENFIQSEKTRMWDEFCVGSLRLSEGGHTLQNQKADIAAEVRNMLG